jgi:hypothetical protein
VNKGVDVPALLDGIFGCFALAAWQRSCEGSEGYHRLLTTFCFPSSYRSSPYAFCPLLALRNFLLAPCKDLYYGLAALRSLAGSHVTYNLEFRTRKLSSSVCAWLKRSSARTAASGRRHTEERTEAGNAQSWWFGIAEIGRREY